jgi:hypothetical protein
MVNHPEHYNQGDIECIDALEACSTKEEFLGWLRLTAIKYLWRAQEKGEQIQDLEKAKWYIDRYKKAVTPKPPQYIIGTNHGDV